MDRTQEEEAIEPMTIEDAEQLLDAMTIDLGLIRRRLREGGAALPRCS